MIFGDKAEKIILNVITQLSRQIKASAFLVAVAFDGRIIRNQNIEIKKFS